MRSRWHKIAEDVFVSREHPAQASRNVIDFLKKHAAASTRRRARLCFHRTVSASIQEMLIVLARGVYIRPHRHPAKIESMHVIEGSAQAVFFNKNGIPQQIIALEACPAAQTFYYRLEEPVYHTVILTSPFLVYLETVSGPFKASESDFAPWSPGENDRAAAKKFLIGLLEDLGNRKKTGPGR